MPTGGAASAAAYAVAAAREGGLQPATVTVMTHYHTAFCERKREVCTAEGALREGNRLRLSCPAVGIHHYHSPSGSGVDSSSSGSGGGGDALPSHLRVAWYRSVDPIEPHTALPVASVRACSASTAPPSDWQQAAGYAGMCLHSHADGETQRAQDDAEAPIRISRSLSGSGSAASCDLERVCRPTGPRERVFPAPSMPSLASLAYDEDPHAVYASLAAGIVGAIDESGITRTAINAAQDSPLFTIAAATRFARCEAQIAHADPLQYKLTLADVGHVLCAVVYAISPDSGLLQAVAETHVIGPIQPAPPRIREVAIDGYARVGNVLQARAVYFGGLPGACQYGWIRVDGEGARTDEAVRSAQPWSPVWAEGADVRGDARCRVLGPDDVGCDFKLMCTPVRADGVQGAPTTSRLTATVTA